MLQTAFGGSCMNRASVYERHKRFKEGWQSVRDDERCVRNYEVHTLELIDQRLRGNYAEVLSEFRKSLRRKRPALFESCQWYFHQDNAPVHYSILVTDYLIKMGIKTFPHPSYNPDLASSDIWLFPKLRGGRYEAIEETKEAVTKVIFTPTQDNF